MIACDTNVLIDYLAGSLRAEAVRLDQELRLKNVVLPPVVVTELLSDPAADPALAAAIVALPLLEPVAGYWQRAGALRALLRGHRLRAPLADTLICQSCLDYGVALLTRDRDFRHYERHAGLKLI